MVIGDVMKLNKFIIALIFICIVLMIIPVNAVIWENYTETIKLNTVYSTSGVTSGSYSTMTGFIGNVSDYNQMVHYQMDFDAVADAKSVLIEQTDNLANVSI